MFGLMSMADFYFLVVFGVLVADLVIIGIHCSKYLSPLEPTVDISIRND